MIGFSLGVWGAMKSIPYPPFFIDVDMLATTISEYNTYPEFGLKNFMFIKNSVKLIIVVRHVQVEFL